MRDLVSANDLDVFKDGGPSSTPTATPRSRRRPRLVLRVPPPMGLMGVGTHRTAIRLCKLGATARPKTALRQEDGEVLFSDVIDALVNRNFDDNPDADVRPRR